MHDLPFCTCTIFGGPIHIVDTSIIARSALHSAFRFLLTHARLGAHFSLFSYVFSPHCSVYSHLIASLRPPSSSPFSLIMMPSKTNLEETDSAAFSVVIFANESEATSSGCQGRTQYHDSLFDFQNCWVANSTKYTHRTKVSTHNCVVIRAVASRYFCLVSVYI
jgi:hypothetical protein